MGRHFIVTSVTGADDEEPPVARPFYIHLSFSAEREHSVDWQGSCNGFAGNARFTATEMKVDQIGSTLVGCEPELEEEDEWLVDFMEADPEWRLDGEQLRLTSDIGTIELSAKARARKRARSGGRR